MSDFNEVRVMKQFHLILCWQGYRAVQWMEEQIRSHCCDLRRNTCNQTCHITGWMQYFILLWSCLISVLAVTAVTGTYWKLVRASQKHPTPRDTRYEYKSPTAFSRSLNTVFYLQTSLTLAGAEGAGAGAASVVPEATGTCGPLRRPLNLPNMSTDLNVHLLVPSVSDYAGNALIPKKPRDLPSWISPVFSLRLPFLL